MDATDDLQRGGLSQEEAFMIACKRLGDEQLLDEEYGKVNASVKTNKIWAYLLFGGNAFYTLPAIVHWLLSLLYLKVYKGLGTGDAAVSIITSSHFFICLMIAFAVINKNAISKFIEAQTQKRILLSIAVSFVPYLVLYLLHQTNRTMEFWKFDNESRPYIERVFTSRWVSYSYYWIYFSIIGGAITLIFSINKPEHLSLKSLFTKPNALFLILTGVFMEILSASKGMIMTDNLALHVMVSGMIYFIPAFALSFYNKQNPLKYLFLICLPGISLEIASKIIVSNTNTHDHTILIILTELGFVVAGYFIGMKAKQRIEIAE